MCLSCEVAERQRHIVHAPAPKHGRNRKERFGQRGTSLNTFICFFRKVSIHNQYRTKKKATAYLYYQKCKSSLVSIAISIFFVGDLCTTGRPQCCSLTPRTAPLKLTPGAFWEPPAVSSGSKNDKTTGNKKRTTQKQEKIKLKVQVGRRREK